jgi:hypothetical protein
MEFDRQEIRVTAALPEIQFLAIDDANYGPLFEADRNHLLWIARYDADLPQPGSSGTIWRTPRERRYRPPSPTLTEESASIEFGSGASDVFNSITAGQFDPGLPPLTLPQPSNPLFAPPPAPPSNFAPTGSLPHLPPPPGAAQHIHINNFTANLNYHATAASSTSGVPLASNVAGLPVVSRPESGGGGPVPPPQPVPFVGGPFPGSYVAPFPAAAAAPPLFQPTLPPPYHSMFMLPPGPSLHFSMYPPAPYHPAPSQTVSTASSFIPENQRQNMQAAHVDREVKVATSRENMNSSTNIMFGSTTVVSVKHSSSDDESADEARHRKSSPRTACVDGEEELEEEYEDPDKSLRCSQEEAGQSEAEQAGIGDGSVLKEAELLCEEVARFSRQQQQQQADQSGGQHDDTGVEEPYSRRHDGRTREALLTEELPIATGPRPTPPPFPNLKAVVVKTTTSPSPPPAQPQISAEPGDEQPAAPHPPTGKSWASLFSPPNPGVERIYTEKPTARIPPFSANNDGPGGVQPAPAGSGAADEGRDLAEFLRSYQLNHVAPALLPRGLSNRSNWCFVNAILQALLACPPFYNLMKGLPAGPADLRSGRSPTPMMDALAEFVSEFAPLEAMSKSQKKDRGRKREDLPVGVPLEPGYVYRVLLQLEADTFSVEEGRQEDAEEFLTCLLNMLSDEMQSLIKLVETSSASQEHEVVDLY